MSTDESSTAQKRHGTLKENIAKLRVELRSLLKMGANVGDFEVILLRMLNQFETERIRAEASYRDLEKKKAYLEANMRSASMYSEVLINLVKGYKDEAVRANENKKEYKLTEDVINEICACGCTDTEDEEVCKCSCHNGTPCDVPYCVPCNELKGTKPTPHPHTRNQDNAPVHGSVRVGTS